MENEFDDEGFLESRFLEKSYQEAMNLTQDVANYLEAESQKTRLNLKDAKNYDINYASESMRLSACLMEVMSWYLVQKSVAAGEITIKQMGDLDFRLGGRAICLSDGDTSKSNLPAEFVFYLKKVQDIYQQVSRIDAMLYEKHEIANPVHEMVNRLNKKD